MNKSVFQILKISSLSVFGLIILGYSLFQAHRLILGPKIDIYTPENGAVYSWTLIEVQGKARNAAYLTLNGGKIFTDKNGLFSEKLLLSPGYNIIKLEAEDKFKSHTEKTLQIILKEY